MTNPLATERTPLSDGSSIPTLGFGTYLLKGAECEQAVRTALEVGYRHIDTAMFYDNHTEISQAIKGYVREELYLTSKVWPGDYTRERIPKACDQILSRLETDYLDLFLIHWPDRSIPFTETLGAMDALRQAGKVRSVGVSNFTIRHLKDAQAANVQLVTNQVECHPFFYQSELKAFCEEHGMRITAYSPLARGEACQNETLMAIGERYGKSATQVTIRFLIQRGCIVIPKTATPKRIVENADVFDFQLSEPDLQAIDQLNRNERTVNPDVADFDYV